MSPRQTIAVVGGGIAGITAAHLIQKKYDVTIFEAGPRLGGHAASVPVLVPSLVEDRFVWLDTAFLIFNELTYPTFMKLVDELGAASSVQKCEMSASFINVGKDLQYALLKGIGSVFYQKKNIFKPAFYRLFWELFQFRKNAYSDLVAGRLGSKTLGHYLADYSESFRNDLVLPLTMAIWSIPAERVWEYPAQSILRFFLNHRLLKGPSGDGWRSFQGSSRKYVTAFEDRFSGKIRKSEPVMKLKRNDQKVTVVTAKGETEFDHIVISLHADDALSTLQEPTDLEKKLLGAWSYFENRVLLHADSKMMPESRKLWSSWNIRQDGNDRSVTYHLNRVQKLSCEQDYFLTLGHCLVGKSSEVGRFSYRHPIYNWQSVETQKSLKTLQGIHRTYYCGSYFGHGFHEDAASSAADVAGLLDCRFD